MKFLKIPEEEQPQVLDEITRKVPYKEIAERYGVTVGYVRLFAFYNGVSHGGKKTRWKTDECRTLMANHYKNERNLDRLVKILPGNRSKKSICRKLTELRKIYGQQGF